MSVVFGIAHHTSRASYLPTLLGRLPEAVIVQTDNVGIGCWPNVKLLMQQVSNLPFTHAVIMPDDVYPCNNFGSYVAGAIAAKPESVFGLFYGQAANTQKTSNGCRDRYARGVAWLRTDFMSGTGTVWPLALLRDFLAWIEGRDAPDNEEFWQGTPKRYSRVKAMDDVRFNRWAKASKQRLWVTVPSLVEHLGNGSSLIDDELHGGYLNTQVVAQCFKLDPGPIDWGRDR